MATKYNSKQFSFLVFAAVLLLIFLFPPLDVHQYYQDIYNRTNVYAPRFSGFDFILYFGKIHPANSIGAIRYSINFPIWIMEVVIAVLVYVGYLKTRD